jgi:hypothetical protein
MSIASPAYRWALSGDRKYRIPEVNIIRDGSQIAAITDAVNSSQIYQ